MSLEGEGVGTPVEGGVPRDPSYCTISEVKEQFTTDKTNEEIQTAINLASEDIEIFTKKKFISEAKTKQVDGNSKDSIFLFERIVSITSIDEIHPVTLASYYSYPSDVFTWYSDEGIVTLVRQIRFPATRVEVFPKGNRNILIQGTFGWSSTPEVVKKSCILLTIDRLKGESIVTGEIGSLAQAEGIKAIKVKDISVSFKEDKDTGSKRITRRTTGNSTVDGLLTQYLDTLKFMVI